MGQRRMLKIFPPLMSRRYMHGENRRDAASGNGEGVAPSAFRQRGCQNDLRVTTEAPIDTIVKDSKKSIGQSVESHVNFVPPIRETMNGQTPGVAFNREGIYALKL